MASCLLNTELRGACRRLVLIRVRGSLRQGGLFDGRATCAPVYSEVNRCGRRGWSLHHSRTADECEQENNQNHWRWSFMYLCDVDRPADQLGTRSNPSSGCGGEYDRKNRPGREYRRVVYRPSNETDHQHPDCRDRRTDCRFEVVASLKNWIFLISSTHNYGRLTHEPVDSTDLIRFAKSVVIPRRPRIRGRKRLFRRAHRLCPVRRVRR